MGKTFLWAVCVAAVLAPAGLLFAQAADADEGQTCPCGHSAAVVVGGPDWADLGDLVGEFILAEEGDGGGRGPGRGGMMRDRRPETDDRDRARDRDRDIDRERERERERDVARERGEERERDRDDRDRRDRPEPRPPFPPHGTGPFGVRPGERPDEPAGRKYGYLGVSPAPVPPPLADQLSLEDGRGVLLVAVLPDSPAGRAGLRQHDVVTAVNEQVIYAVEQLQKLVAAQRPGTAVRLSLIRKARPLTVKVELGGTARQAWTEVQPRGLLGGMLSRLGQLPGGPMQGLLGGRGPMAGPFGGRGPQPQMGTCQGKCGGACPMCRMMGGRPGPMPPAPSGPRGLVKPPMPGEAGKPGEPHPRGPMPGGPRGPEPMHRPAPGGPRVEMPERPAPPPLKLPSARDLLKSLEPMKGEFPPKAWERLRDVLEDSRRAGRELLEALEPLKGDLPPKLWEKIKEALTPKAPPPPRDEPRGFGPFRGERGEPERPEPRMEQRQIQVHIGGGPGGVRVGEGQAGGGLATAVVTATSANYRATWESRSGQPTVVSLYDRHGKPIFEKVVKDKLPRLIEKLDDEARELLERAKMLQVQVQGD